MTMPFPAALGVRSLPDGVLEVRIALQGGPLDGRSYSRTCPPGRACLVTLGPRTVFLACFTSGDDTVHHLVDVHASAARVALLEDRLRSATDDGGAGVLGAPSWTVHAYVYSGRFLRSGRTKLPLYVLDPDLDISSLV